MSLLQKQFCKELDAYKNSNSQNIPTKRYLSFQYIFNYFTTTQVLN